MTPAGHRRACPPAASPDGRSPTPAAHLREPRLADPREPLALRFEPAASVPSRATLHGSTGAASGSSPRGPLHAALAVAGRRRPAARDLVERRPGGHRRGATPSCTPSSPSTRRRVRRRRRRAATVERAGRRAARAAARHPDHGQGRHRRGRAAHPGRVGSPTSTIPTARRGRRSPGCAPPARSILARPRPTSSPSASPTPRAATPTTPPASPAGRAAARRSRWPRAWAWRRSAPTRGRRSGCRPRCRGIGRLQADATAASRPTAS